MEFIPSTKTMTDLENENLTNDVSKDLTIEELETLEKKISNEYDRSLEQLNRKKKYYGVKDEELTLPAGSVTDVILAMMEGVLKAGEEERKSDDEK